jgi:hypothetical protein
MERRLEQSSPAVRSRGGQATRPTASLEWFKGFVWGKERSVLGPEGRHGGEGATRRAERKQRNMAAWLGYPCQRGHGCTRARVGARGCAWALELARRVPRFGFGRTVVRWRDEVGCAGDRRRLDRGGEPGNEHVKRWRGEAGSNHNALVSGRKGPTLASHGECVYTGALGCAVMPRPAGSRTKQTRGKSSMARTRW